MRCRLTLVLGVACAALLLAVLELRLGVHTDEAKYLLNVPYPHPPLARFLLGLTDGWMFQEQLWRIVFAFALLSGGFLAMDLVDRPYKAERASMLLIWIGCAAVLLQAGTVMMAPLSALFLLLFLWSLRRTALPEGVLGLLWLASLFTAYQGALALPIVWSAVRRRKASHTLTAGIVGIPLLLLALYTLTNPLAAAALLGRGSGSGAGQWGVVLLLLGMAGSFLGSGIGMVGLCRAPRAVLMSLALTLAYFLTSPPHEYYAILLTPYLVYGIATMLAVVPGLWRGVAVGVPLVGIALLAATMRLPQPVPARIAAEVLRTEGITGTVLLAEPFGHEWQYELSNALLRYEPHLLPRAEAVVCPVGCPALTTWGDSWERLEGAPVEMWVHR